MSKRTIAFILVMLLALFGGTWMVIKLATGHLLYENATGTARDWAHHLVENVTDLVPIAGGEQPSNESLAFFKWAKETRLVYRYEIYNRQGYLQLVSDRNHVGFVDVSKLSPEAAKAAATGQTVVEVRRGKTSDEPRFYSEAYVPIKEGSRTVAVVGAEVDQTAIHDRIYQTFLIAALALCLLMALAFALPAAA